MLMCTDLMLWKAASQAAVSGTEPTGLGRMTRPREGHAGAVEWALAEGALALRGDHGCCRLPELSVASFRSRKRTAAVLRYANQTCTVPPQVAVGGSHV